MKINELEAKLGLQQVTKLAPQERELEGGYVGDLLSNVMGQAQPGMLWVTMQGHPNVAAVATLLDLAGVVVTGGTKVEPDLIAKAEANNLPVFATDKSSYEIVSELAAQGLQNGSRK